MPWSNWRSAPAPRCWPPTDCRDRGNPLIHYRESRMARRPKSRLGVPVMVLVGSTARMECLISARVRPGRLSGACSNRSTTRRRRTNMPKAQYYGSPPSIGFSAAGSSISTKGRGNRLHCSRIVSMGWLRSGASRAALQREQHLLPPCQGSTISWAARSSTSARKSASASHRSLAAVVLCGLPYSDIRRLQNEGLCDAHSRPSAPRFPRNVGYREQPAATHTAKSHWQAM